MERARGLLKLGYWSYLGLGSLVMLIVTLAEESWWLAVLSGGVLALAAWRLSTLRSEPNG